MVPPGAAIALWGKCFSRGAALLVQRACLNRCDGNDRINQHAFGIVRQAES